MEISNCRFLSSNNDRVLPQPFSTKRLFIQYKSKKCTFPKLIFNFLMTSCFETEGSSSGRRLYIQLLYDAFYTLKLNTKKCKAVPLQAWSDPDGSRKLRFPDFITTAQDGSKVVSLTHRPSLPPGNTPGTHFC